jgi:N-acetylglucosaminyldiphosphoundecaprenol N-acetyl-beta-D-mannosaminyltransferase
LDILGVPVSVFPSRSHAVDTIVERVVAGHRTFCVAVNPEKIYRARRNRQLLSLLRAADIHVCDGIGASLAGRLLHGRKVCRVTGIQLFLDLIARASEKGLSVYLLGASPESNAGACRRIGRDHPNLRIAGACDGYFPDSDAVVRQINESGADMVFVAMGSPKQEQWIYERQGQIDAPLCMGVGGSFDVLSGRTKWAPRLVRQMGIEFLYRLVMEPRRWRRQVCLPVFAWEVITSRLRGMPGAEPHAPAPPMTIPFPVSQRDGTFAEHAEPAEVPSPMEGRKAA